MKILNLFYEKRCSEHVISLELKPFKFHSKFLYSLPGSFLQFLRQITAMNPQDAGAMISDYPLQCGGWSHGGVLSD